LRESRFTCEHEWETRLLAPRIDAEKRVRSFEIVNETFLENSVLVPFGCLGWER